ncbi:hypothetical protein [Polycladidibacter hongkongensis]|uniref:hypothetical protein n=1 Tax=Polycladidibacter hongkongensis TaxID=1647556 RepID=UPI00082F7448|nr:hypothetical protein [Pseudovibrio hongkongensis]
MPFLKADPASAHLTPCNALLAAACKQHGLELYLEEAFQYSGYFKTKAGTLLPFKGTSLPVNAYGAAAVAADKGFCAELLASQSLSTPTGIVLAPPATLREISNSNPQAAIKTAGFRQAEYFSAHHGFPLFIKPNDGTQGKGVYKVDEAAQLLQRFNELAHNHPLIRLEVAATGTDLRIIVLDGEVQAVIRRDPPFLNGDGASSLAQLLDSFETQQQTRSGGKKISQEDNRLAAHLARSGWQLHDIPPKGAKVTLLPSANLSTGGTATLITGDLAPCHAQTAIAAAKAVGLRYAGVDLMVEDVTAQTSGAYKIIELNAGPGLVNFLSADPSHARIISQIYNKICSSLKGL